MNTICRSRSISPTRPDVGRASAGAAICEGVSGPGIKNIAQVAPTLNTQAAIASHREHLSHGELELRRARARVAWALDLFVRRYGSFGIERVGGGKSAEALVAATPGSALDAFSALATRAALAS